MRRNYKMELFILMLLVVFGVPIIIVDISLSIKNFRSNNKLKEKWLTQKYNVNTRKCPCCGFPIPSFGRFIHEGLQPIIIKKYRIEQIRCKKCKFSDRIVVRYDER